MTEAESSGVIAEALLNSPYPTIAIDLHKMAILGANEAAYRILGRPPNSLDGAPPTDIVSGPDRPAVDSLLSLLTSGTIDGYRAVRRFEGADGSEFTANITVHLTTTNGTKFGLVTLEDTATPVPWRVLHGGTHIALAMTDHDWIIEHISSDIEQILGQGPETYKGSPLLGLFRPSVVPNFMSAVGRIATGGDGATMRVHLRAQSDRWVEGWCVVVPMCRHSPPRLGLAISDVAELDAELPSELQRHLGALCADALGAMDNLQSRVLSAPFSTRQWEILTCLTRGERVQDIATALYLSPSTVRNHLTAIYRKFGVHSQAELLATLLNSPT